MQTSLGPLESPLTPHWYKQVLTSNGIYHVLRYRIASGPQPAQLHWRRGLNVERLCDIATCSQWQRLVCPGERHSALDNHALLMNFVTVPSLCATVVHLYQLFASKLK